MGEGGGWVGVVDDQHRSENFENILLLGSWRTGRQTAAAAGGDWFGLQEVLESPGTNAGRTYICFLLFTYEHQYQLHTATPSAHKGGCNICVGIFTHGFFSAEIVFGSVNVSKSGRKWLFF